VHIAWADETAYTDLPESMEDLAKPIQQRDAFVKEKLQQINQGEGKEAERSPWDSKVLLILSIDGRSAHASKLPILPANEAHL
jgi:hypothetical protein